MKKIYNKNKWSARTVSAIFFTFHFSFFTLFTSCDSFLDVQPTGKVIAKTGEEYRALLTGVYSTFPEDRSKLTTLRTDEIVLDASVTSAEDMNSYIDIWTWNDVTKGESTTSFSWRTYYHAIYIANYIIEHQSEITDAPADTIRQLVGESYMLRAYCHFLLANLYGEDYTHCSDTKSSLAVPLITEADVEAVPERNSVEEIYQQILADIESARQNLTVKEWADPACRYRFCGVSADALKARVCLYMGRWKESLEASKAVIESHPALEDLTKSGFTMPDNYKSAEGIVCLEHEIKLLDLDNSSWQSVGLPNTQFITDNFRTGDLRKNYYVKAKTSKVYEMRKGTSRNQCRSTFRSSEFYLTAAEAAARLGNRTEAISLISPLINSRYMTAMQQKVIAEMEAMTLDELIAAILRERTCELCFEGHRWFDLRRTSQPKIVRTWENTDYTLEQGDNRYTIPIPTEALNANPNLK